MGDKTQSGVPAGVVDTTKIRIVSTPGSGGRIITNIPRPGGRTPQAKNKGGYIKRKKGGSARKG